MTDCERLGNSDCLLKTLEKWVEDPAPGVALTTACEVCYMAFMAKAREMGLIP